MSNFTAQPVAFGSKAAPDAQVQIAPHQPDVVGLRIDPTRKGTQTADLMKVFSLLGEEIFTIEPDGTTLIKDLIVTGSMSAETSATSLDVTTLNVLGTAYFSDGTSALPSIAFDSDPDTGIFRQGSGILVVTSNGASALAVGTNVQVKNDLYVGDEIFVTGEAYLSDGTSAAPAYSFTADTDTGIFRQGSGILVLANNGASGMTLDASKNMVVAGSIATPLLSVTTSGHSIYDEIDSASIGLLSVTTSGHSIYDEIHEASVGLLSVTTSGHSIYDEIHSASIDLLTVTTSGHMIYEEVDSSSIGLLSITTSGHSVYDEIHSASIGLLAVTTSADIPYMELDTIALSNGTSATPSLTFASDLDTGIYRTDTDTLAFATSGVSGMYINQYGNIFARGTITLPGNLKMSDNPVQFYAPSGSYWLPGITTFTDDNTGIFFDGAGKISIGTDGTEALFIDADQDVHIVKDSIASGGDTKVKNISILGGNTWMGSGNMGLPPNDGELPYSSEAYGPRTIEYQVHNMTIDLGAAPSEVPLWYGPFEYYTSATMPTVNSCWGIYDVDVTGMLVGLSVESVVIAAQGSGYGIGDVVWVDSMRMGPGRTDGVNSYGYDCSLVVANVDLTTSAATAVTISNYGTFYVDGETCDTVANSPGIGTGLTVTVCTTGNGTFGDTAAFKITGAFKNCGAVITVASCAITILYRDDDNWNVTAHANETDGAALAILVSGALFQQIAWNATVKLTSIYRTV